MATSFQGYIEGTGGREPQEESIVEEGIEDPRLRKVGIVVEKLVRFLAKHVDPSLEEIVGLFGTDGLNLVEILKEIDRELEEFEEIRAPQLLTQERIHKVIFIKGVPNALWRLDAGVYGYLKQIIRILITALIQASKKGEKNRIEFKEIPWVLKSGSHPTLGEKAHLHVRGMAEYPRAYQNEEHFKERILNNVLCEFIMAALDKEDNILQESILEAIRDNDVAFINEILKDTGEKKVETILWLLGHSFGPKIILDALLKMKRMGIKLPKNVKIVMGGFAPALNPKLCGIKFLQKLSPETTPAELEEVLEMVDGAFYAGLEPDQLFGVPQIDPTKFKHVKIVELKGRKWERRGLILAHMSAMTNPEILDEWRSFIQELLQDLFAEVEQ
ncbi:MAG: hypothetical protein ACD_28C00035G0020 [uncultured bacterium]|nr:MAG: hypothetical protein ACD_28C00035G0020 [uncultured bacterium]